MPRELPEDLERYIDDSIASRTFASREKIIADAAPRHRERACRLKWLREEVHKRIDQLDRGEGYIVHGNFQTAAAAGLGAVVMIDVRGTPQ